MNRRCLFTILFATMILPGLLIPAAGQASEPDPVLAFGERVNLSSQVLGEDRSLWIYLPDSYEESRESYPVFYLLDGDIHFHHVTGIVEVLSKFAHMPKMIVVAVVNVDRERDFLPSRMNNWPPAPAADKFHTFLKTELIPWVDKRYRTRPFRILCGHSFGGVFCAHAFLTDPRLFTAFIAISPALEWDDRLLIKMADRVLKKTSFDHQFLFLATSPDDEGAVPASREFAALLDKYSPAGLTWRCDFMEDDDHLSIVHPTIYNALKWIHKGWRLSEKDLAQMTLKEVLDHYEKISTRYGSRVPVPEGVFFNLGYAFMDKKDWPAAKEAFEANIKYYPDQPSGYVGLGDAYEEEGKLEMARKNYEKGLALAKKNNDTMVIPVATGLLERVVKKIKE